jgi:hypothetical protein
VSAAVITPLIIGAITIFMSSISTAIIVGMFVGGLRSEVRLMSDRLAKIEGLFTLVPRQPGDTDVKQGKLPRKTRWGNLWPYVRRGCSMSIPVHRTRPPPGRGGLGLRRYRAGQS